MKKLISIIFVLIVLIGVVILTLYNSEDVIFSFVKVKYEVPIAIVMIVSLSVGVLAGVSLFIPDIIQNKKDKRKINFHEKEKMKVLKKTKNEKKIKAQVNNKIDSLE